MPAQRSSKSLGRVSWALQLLLFALLFSTAINVFSTKNALHSSFGNLDLSLKEFLGTSSQHSQERPPRYTAITPPNAASTSMDRLQPSRPTSKYAYAYVIGGVNPAVPAYKGFLYNIYVSASILREQGSTADIVVFFQMSYASPTDELPEDEMAALEQMNVKVRYIPKDPDESFFRIVINKFRILEMTEYRRVILMDGDVMPIANLDYLFALSDGENAVLKENVVVAGKLEPANAGFFMLEPKAGDFELIQGMVKNHLDRALRKELPANSSQNGALFSFDETEGWGHVITPPDKWVLRSGGFYRKDPPCDGTKWCFAFAFSDQGLLYHWTKYVKQSVSIFFEENRVESWSASAESHNGTQVKEDLTIPSRLITEPKLHVQTACNKFLCGFVHFTGNDKPWMSEPFAHNSRHPQTVNLWWKRLSDLNDELKLEIDLKNWVSKHGPPLGKFATLTSLQKEVNIHQKR